MYCTLATTQQTSANMALRDQILHSLATNQRAIEKALVLLYRRQTVDEQQAKQTRCINGRGFNAADASVLTVYAEHILSGRTLSDGDYDEAGHRLRKYVGQLEDEVIAREIRRLERQP